MIVRDLDIVGITVDEPEANTPLIVYTDRMLPFPVPYEFMKVIPGRNFEIFYSRCQIHVLKLCPSPPGYIRWYPFRFTSCI
jgi:hypothetical protein